MQHKNSQSKALKPNNLQNKVKMTVHIHLLQSNLNMQINKNIPKTPKGLYDLYLSIYGILDIMLCSKGIPTL